MKPIVINTLQLRLAMELAAQSAACEEIKHQVQQQLPGINISVSGCAMNIEIRKWPTFDMLDHRVVWE